MAFIDSLANAIATMEGFFAPNSNRSQVNNNPGNLRAGVGQVGVDSKGLAVFASPEAGWNALYHQIGLDANRGLTLGEFINKYAPPTENNTSQYLSYVSGRTGVGSGVVLSDAIAAGGGNSANVVAPASSDMASGTDLLPGADLLSGGGGGGASTASIAIALAAGILGLVVVSRFI